MLSSQYFPFHLLKNKWTSVHCAWHNIVNWIHTVDYHIPIFFRTWCHYTSFDKEFFSYFISYYLPLVERVSECGWRMENPLPAIFYVQLEINIVSFLYKHQYVVDGQVFPCNSRILMLLMLLETIGNWILQNLRNVLSRIICIHGFFFLFYLTWQ